MEKIEERALYYNEQVIRFLEMIGKKPGFIKVFKAGRGAGKTRSIPEDLLDRASELPKARIFLMSYSYKTIYDNIFPDLHEVFKLHGLVEDEDYVVDKKPPAHFDLPYKRIEDYMHSISFFNGFAVQLLSAARKVAQIRGKSFDGGIIDEALLIKGNDFNKIIYPTIRGFDYWNRSPYWKLLSIYSSQPRDPEGSWFLRYRKLAEKYPERYGWVEATAMDNVVVVGEDYIDNQKAVLDYVDFQFEIMNKGEIKDLPDRFYYEFNEDKHCYEAPAISMDIVMGAALDLSFDFGGNYSCLTVSQERNGTEYYVKEFDTNQVTEEQRQSGVVKKLPHIVQDFIDFFSSTHGRKHVRIWGDRVGLNKNVMDDKNYFEQIQDQLKKAGWSSELLVTYNDSGLHKSRWSFLNSCFEEKIEDYPRIRINALRCPNLVQSLLQTKITDEFKKDKSQESNKHFNQSHAPHLGDTMDYKIFNKYFYLVDESFADGLVDTNIDSV